MRSGPNCSYAPMTPDGTGYSGPVTAPAEQLHQYPATGSNTWLDQCWELYGAGIPYYSQASTASGNGACMLIKSTWFQCPPLNEAEIAPATTEGGFKYDVQPHVRRIEPEQHRPELSKNRRIPPRHSPVRGYILCFQLLQLDGLYVWGSLPVRGR
jgi:hypothetical protein